MDQSAPHGRAEMSGAIASRYWEGMDKTMPAKLALMSGLMLLDAGSTIVDAGSGSGAAAYHLAKLNPRARIIGIDLDPAAVAAAARKYQLPNLSFEAGDISQPLPEKVDAILSSSTLHHVFAFQQPAYSIANVEAALANHAASLKDGGVLALRDFVIPDRPDTKVILSLRDEGRTAGNYQDLDEPTLLERFSRQARPLDTAHGPGFPLEELSADGAMRRFRLSLGDATEFLLRKDYRLDWEAELLEQYGYLTRAGFLDAFVRAGFADARAIPVFNHWIIANRWRNKVALHREDGALVRWPATNILVSGRKIASGAHRIQWKRSDTPVGYLKSEHLMAPDKRTWTVVQRPTDAIEILPYCVAEGELRIVARDGHARPLATVADPSHPGRTIEPLAYAADAPRDSAEALTRLGFDAGLAAGPLEPLLSYLPSGGGIAERVQAFAVPLVKVPSPFEVGVNDLSRPTSVRSFDAIDILRAGQAGSLDEARLEIAVAALMRARSLPLGEWVAEKLALAEDPLSVVSQPPAWAGKFTAAPEPKAPWITIRSGRFQDLDRAGAVLAETTLEWAEPADGFPASATILPVRHAIDPATGEKAIEIGLERRLLPAAQLLMGDARIECVPAWRLKSRPADSGEAERFVPGNHRAALTPLGGAYYASLGIATERVFPFVLDARHFDPAMLPELVFTPLKGLVARPSAIVDGHLLISALRAAHLFGL